MQLISINHSMPPAIVITILIEDSTVIHINSISISIHINYYYQLLRYQYCRRHSHIQMWNHHLCHIHLHHHNYQYRCHNQRRYLLGFTRHRHHRNQQYRSIGCITLSSPLSSGRYEDCFVCVLVGVVLQGACVGLGCVLARRENENYGCSCWGVSCCNTGFMA